MSHVLAVYSLAFLLGGMTLFSGLLAPLVFLRLPKDTAGRFIRTLFPWYYLYILVFAGLALLALLVDYSRPLSILALALVLGLGVYARQTLMPAINRLRDAADQGDSAAAARFAHRHQVSVIINGVQWLVVLVTLGALADGPLAAAGPRPLASAECPNASGWFDGRGRPTHWSRLVQGHAGRRVWLLGEQHGQAEQHAWQLQVLTALHAESPDLVLAMEMFPRSSQAALDTWVAGSSTWEAFLAESRWNEVWGFDPDLYRPILDYARRNQIPVVALNIDPALARRVGDVGWAAVPEGERLGIGTPAPAGRAYRKDLEAVFATHAEWRSPPSAEAASSDWVHAKPEDQKPAAPTADAATTRPAADEAAFKRFVDVQLLWDRAMAEAIARTLAGEGAHRRVVALLGRGHIGPKRGVGLQLADLGVVDTVTLLPTTQGEFCAQAEDRGKPVAQGLFVLPELPGGPGMAPDTVPRPRLGVSLGVDLAGARVIKVLPDSLAEREGLHAGDIITHIAGQAVTGPDQVIASVRVQPPGTWLPIELKRNGEERRQVIRFPVDTASAPSD